jgi:hypothetical protein
MVGRRRFLGTLGATAVAVAAVGTIGQELPIGVQLSSAGLGPRARFGRCEVLSLESTPDGAVCVRLMDSARRPFEVLLLGHDDRTPGVARAGSLAVFMKNNGDGTTATVEEHGLAAMALAHRLARAEAAGAKLPALPTLVERSATPGIAAA